MNDFLIASKDTCCASEDQNEAPKLAADNYLTRAKSIIFSYLFNIYLLLLMLTFRLRPPLSAT